MLKNSPLTGSWLTISWINDRRTVDPRPTACRTVFTVNKAENITLRITSCEYYALFINGEYAAFGPARSTVSNKSYDEIDITGFVRTGSNALALLVTEPTGESSHRGRNGWWCDCFDADGNLLFCTGKENWKCRVADWYGDFCEPRSLSSGRQEHIFAGKEEKNWKTLPLEELSAQWHAPFVMGDICWTPPYRKIRKRGTLMQQRMDLPLNVTGYFTAQKELYPINEMADKFNALDFVKGDKTAFSGKLCAGEVYTFDLGKTRTFLPRIKVLEGNENIRLESFCDVRHFDRPQASNPYETAGAGFADSYTLCRDGGQEFFPIVPIGGRFWSLRAAGEGECRVEVRIQAVEYPYEPQNCFRSSDPVLEKFMDIAGETIRSSTQEVFVDTCWREQALWTEDATVSGIASFYTFGDLAVWKESLRLIGESITPDGVSPAVVPGDVSHLVLTDQTFSWVMSLKQYFMISGDDDFISEMRTPVLNFLRLMREYINNDGLFAPPVWSWHFVDFAEIDRRPWSLAINTMLYSALNAALDLYGPTGKDGEFLSDFAELSHKGLMKFWDEENGFFVNHLSGADPALGETVFYNPANNFEVYPIHGNSLLLAQGLFPKEFRENAAAQLAGWLEETFDNNRTFGTCWMRIIAKALFYNGQSAFAWKLVRQRYMTALEADAPTYGEDFPFKKFNSSHGWSSGIAEVLMAQVWGLQIIEPGFRKISVKPAAGLPDGEVELNTPGGKLHLAMKDGQLQILQCDMQMI